MFQKPIAILFTLLFFVACTNAKPVPEGLESDKVIHEPKETVEVQTEEKNIVVDQVEKETLPDKPQTETPKEKPIKSHEEIKPVPEEVQKQEVISEVEPVESEVVVENKTEDVAPEPDLVTLPALSHQIWDELLQKYVSSTGKVNYAGMKKEKVKLQQYLDLLAANPVQNSWSRNKKMAYWINAYNAFTVKLIVDHYPVSSITKIHSGKPWSKKWIKLGSETYSLDQIENEILRPRYKDARIHFAVNCAAKSCPPLLNKAWTAENLEANFEKQARNFINNSNYNKIGEKKVQISKIFEWYAGDFDNIINYLNKYAQITIKSNAKVTYLEYDWALNE